MRQFYLFFCFLLAVSAVNAQSIFQFSVLNDTVHEPDGIVTIGYIKTNLTSTQTQNFSLSILSGSGTAADINNFATTTITLPALTDSVPVTIAITNDSIVEFPENILFVLRPKTAADSLGADSILTLTILDNEIPATIGFLKPQDTIWENTPIYVVKVVCNNPNPTGVRCYIRADDLNSTTTGGIDFGFGWQFIYFKPGLDTITVPAYSFDDNNQESLETLVLKLNNFDANNCADSSFTLFIKDDDSPQPISISFTPDTTFSVYEDTARAIPIYVKATNPWSKTFYFQIATNYEGTAKAPDYSLTYNHDPQFAAPPGDTYDTVFVLVKNDPFVEDTEVAYIRFRYASVNTSPDSVYTVHIFDRDTAEIGFLGAAYSFLENQGKCTVKLVTTSPLKVPVTLPVTYYNGNATLSSDFIFHDTIVTFPAMSIDTQEVYITLLDDYFDEANEQINLRIGDPSPANIAKTGIRQFSFFIIDNDSTALGIEDNETMVSAYPNPVASFLNLTADFPMQSIQVMSMDGKTVYASFLDREQKITLNTSDWNSGLYILRITSEDKVKTLRIRKN